MNLFDPCPTLTTKLQAQLLKTLRRRYPFVYEKILTKSAYGRDVYALQLGSGEQKVLLTAAHHANESMTGLILWRFLFEFCEAVCKEEAILEYDALELFRHSMIYLVPLVNPDGADLVGGAIDPDSGEARSVRAIAAQYPQIPFPSGWKANTTGVDLNLNYPARWDLARTIKGAQGICSFAPRDYVGQQPLDQPESAALAAYTECIRPDLMLALHTQGGVIYPGAEETAPEESAALAAQFARVSGYTVERTPPESDNAGFKDWFLQRFHRPAFTIEAGRGENPLPPEQFEEVYRQVAPIILAALAW